MYKAQIEELKKKHKDKLARLERKFYDEKMSLQKQFQLKLMDLRKLSHEEAVTKLGDTTKQLFVENRSMTEELHVQVQVRKRLFSFQCRLLGSHFQVEQATEKLKMQKKHLEEE